MTYKENLPFYTAKGALASLPKVPKVSGFRSAMYVKKLLEQEQEQVLRIDQAFIPIEYTSGW